ncbi:hypothetical protein [Ekhidna sp.]
MKYNFTLLAGIVLVLFLFAFGIKTNQQQEKLILNGKGFDNYQIGITSISEIIRELGDNFQKVDHNGYSTELIYHDLGLSFYYEPKISETISAIEFFYPFKGTTDKGITLNESTMADVQAVHDSLDWYIAGQAIEWYSEYPGIEYAVPRDTTLPKYPLDEELHKKLKITRIVVLDNFEEFEED